MPISSMTARWRRVATQQVPRYCLFALACLLGVAPAQAEWSGGIDGGTVIGDEGTSNRLRLKLTNDARPFTHFIYADWLRTGTDDAFEVGYLPKFWFTEQLYLFGEARGRVDKPLLIDRETMLLGGAGVQLLSTETTSIFVEAGAGQRTTEFVTGLEDQEMLGLARTGLSHRIAEFIQLDFNATASGGETLTETRGEAGIALVIPGGVVRYSYRFRRVELDGQPAVDDNDSFISYSVGF